MPVPVPQPKHLQKLEPLNSPPPPPSSFRQNLQIFIYLLDYWATLNRVSKIRFLSQIGWEYLGTFVLNKLRVCVARLHPTTQGYVESPPLGIYNRCEISTQLQLYELRKMFLLIISRSRSINNLFTEWLQVVQTHSFTQWWKWTCCLATRSAF